MNAAVAIAVGEAPRLLSGVSDVTVIAPEVATLACSVKLGSRDADICWFKNAKQLYAGRKYEMLYWDNVASLVIKDTQPGDSGSYRCEVASALGRVDSIGALTVYSEY
jgi:hypothetical protein